MSHSSSHALLSNSSKVRHLLYGLREGGKEREGREEEGERERERERDREEGSTCTGCYQGIVYGAMLV